MCGRSPEKAMDTHGWFCPGAVRDSGRRSRGAFAARRAQAPSAPSHVPSLIARGISTWWGRFVLKHEASKAELQAFVFREAGIRESLTFMVTASAWQKSAT